MHSLFTYLAIFSPFFLEPISYFSGRKLDFITGVTDEILIGILLLLLFDRWVQSKVTIPASLVSWIPFLLLGMISVLVNFSPLIWFFNLLLTYTKPFIVAVAVINFFSLQDLGKMKKIFIAVALIQVPFLLFQVAKYGYLTGADADLYIGALGDAHLVGAITIIPALWLMAEVLHDNQLPSSKKIYKVCLSLLFLFLAILCEAKQIYMGAVLGFATAIVFFKGKRMFKPTILALFCAMGGLIFFFGFHYFQSLDYYVAFEFIQKMNAYYITFYELPLHIPFPFVGAGPGTYGTSIAFKAMPELTQHFYGTQLADLAVGGTFMTPFSTINGIIGEMGYLAPFTLFFPYLVHAVTSLSYSKKEADKRITPAVMTGFSLLILSLITSSITTSLAFAYILFPAFALISVSFSNRFQT